jgi:hypothetical protein
MTNTNERLAYLKAHLENQRVKVEVPAQTSITTKGTVIYRFNGTRMGHNFKDGIAHVKKEDVHLFNHQHYIIHDTNEKDGK